VGLDLPDRSTDEWMFWWEACIDLYFALDMLLMFRTATWTRIGEREVNGKVLARNYLKGWFGAWATSRTLVHLHGALHSISMSGAYPTR
jgi:hypothetical protein